MVENGVHLLDYPRVIYTDGCGSMVHVRSMAVSIGIIYIAIPPHSQRASMRQIELVVVLCWDLFDQHGGVVARRVEARRGLELTKSSRRGQRL